HPFIIIPNKLFNFLKQSMKRFYFLFLSTLFFAPSFLFGANIENIKKYRNSIERKIGLVKSLFDTAGNPLQLPQKWGLVNMP
ncbi:hypothetical protein CYC97_09120, partial [Campylobacter coli]|nr:hypothetical protein [Campylobacter coli]